MLQQGFDKLNLPAQDRRLGGPTAGMGRLERSRRVSRPVS